MTEYESLLVPCGNCEAIRIKRLKQAIVLASVDRRLRSVRNRTKDVVNRNRKHTSASTHSLQLQSLSIAPLNCLRLAPTCSRASVQRQTLNALLLVCEPRHTCFRLCFTNRSVRNRSCRVKGAVCKFLNIPRRLCASHMGPGTHCIECAYVSSANCAIAAAHLRRIVCAACGHFNVSHFTLGALHKPQHV